MENNGVEKGSAIIQLAQIIIIFSGFLFATGGIIYTNSINVLSTSLPALNSQSFELIKMNKLNLTIEEVELLKYLTELNKSYLEQVNPQLELAKLSFYLGGFLAFVSFLIWCFGYWKINKAEKNENA